VIAQSKVPANIGPIALLVAAVLASGLMDPRILAGQNLMIILTQSVPVLMLALGAFIALLTGGIDLSAGVAVTLGSLVIASTLTAGCNLPVALLAGSGALLTVGMVNGVLISLLRVPAFVATLASMSVVQGIGLLMAKRGVYILSEPPLRYLGLGRLGGVPVSLCAAVIVIAVAYVLMHHTRFGLRVYATGSDSNAAALARVPTSKIICLTYVAASLFSFLSALTLVARTPIVTPNVGGQPLLLDAIAACVLGGTSIFGGRGTVLGVVAGTLIVGLFSNALRVVGIDPSSLDLMKGALVIAALVCDVGMISVRQKFLKESIR
jgi:ribose transport system permease protein